MKNAVKLLVLGMLSFLGAGLLLNGSNYNFIFIGNEESLERVILPRRDPNQF